MGFFVVLFIIFLRIVVRVKCPLLICTQGIRDSYGCCPILIDFTRVMPCLEYMVFIVLMRVLIGGHRVNCRHAPGSPVVGVVVEVWAEELVPIPVPVR